MGMLDRVEYENTINQMQGDDLSRYLAMQLYDNQIKCDDCLNVLTDNTKVLRDHTTRIKILEAKSCQMENSFFGFSRRQLIVITAIFAVGSGLGGGFASIINKILPAG